MTIYLEDANLDVEERKWLDKAFDEGCLSTRGKLVSEFESRMAEYFNTPDAVATSSGSMALRIAFKAMNMNDKCIVRLPVLRFQGAENIIRDFTTNILYSSIDETTWNMLPRSTYESSFVIPIHMYGNPCDMETIMTKACESNTIVIEDACEALGSTLNNQLMGTFGDLGCFSFNGNKIITCGSGGLIIGHDKYLLKYCRSLSRQHPVKGDNGRMNNLSAAVGLAQLQKLQGFLDKKQYFHDIYTKELSDIFDFQQEYSEAKSNWWYTAGVSKVSDLKDKMKQTGIPFREVFQNHGLISDGICLPCSTKNSGKEIFEVCEAIKDCLTKPSS